MFSSLKGCLWKPGVNGLGVFGFHSLPYRRLFDEAARLHDAHYDLMGDGHSRLTADRLFLIDMARASDKGIQVSFAIIYYIFVRLIGWAFYRYNRA